MQFELETSLQRGHFQRSGYRHRRFGDLGRVDAVALKGEYSRRGRFEQRSPICVHVSVTSRCNARCKGCLNSYFQNKYYNEALCGDMRPGRDSKAVLELLGKFRGQEAWVCLHGGEPLLRLKRIREFTVQLESNEWGRKFNYMIYTNGHYLHRALVNDIDLMKKVGVVSVAIDGRKHQHQAVRRGTDLKTIHKGLRSFKRHADGQVLMRSTLREEQSLYDCFREFYELYEQGLADQFYWQWVKSAEPFDEFEDYLLRYEKEFAEIIRVYVEGLRRGEVLPICHVNELVLFMLSDVKRRGSACGVESGHKIGVMDGSIHYCRELPAEWAAGVVEGDGSCIFNGRNPLRLVDHKNETGCRECGIRDYCGGRCPAEAMSVGAVRLFQNCQLMRLHVAVLKQHINEIAVLLREKNICLQDIYDRSAYYTHFTDVTP